MTKTSQSDRVFYCLFVFFFSVGPLVGLFTLAIAGGNIKPCMAAFGGDQLPQKDVSIK